MRQGARRLTSSVISEAGGKAETLEAEVCISAVGITANTDGIGLEALGVNIQLSAAQVGQCLDEVGIAFCFAPLFHGAMKHAAPVRKQLRFRTIFNLVGPLSKSDLSEELQKAVAGLKTGAITPGSP